MARTSATDRQLVASVLDAMNKGDADEWLRLIRPEYEFHAKFVALEGRVYRGPRGLHKYLKDVAEVFEDPRWELQEVEPASGDDLLVVVRFTARGRGSGAPVNISAPAIWTFKEDLLWRSVTYSSRAEALEAAGSAA